MIVERTSIILDLLRWERVLAPTTLKGWVCPGMRCQEVATWAQQSVPATPLSIASVVVGTHLGGPRDVGLSLAVPSTFCGTRSVSLAWACPVALPLGEEVGRLVRCPGLHVWPRTAWAWAACLAGVWVPGHLHMSAWVTESRSGSQKTWLSCLAFCLPLGAYFPHEGVTPGSSSCPSWAWGRHLMLHIGLDVTLCFIQAAWLGRAPGGETGNPVENQQPGLSTQQHLLPVWGAVLLWNLL